MKKTVNKHKRKIKGMIACFDRILFKGYLSINWAENMDRFITSQGLLLKDFKRFFNKHFVQAKEHARP